MGQKTQHIQYPTTIPDEVKPDKVLFQCLCRKIAHAYDHPKRYLSQSWTNKGDNQYLTTQKLKGG